MNFRFVRKMRLLLALILTMPAALFSQTFTASVNNTTVGLNEQFQISFTFSGPNVNGASNFNQPNFNGFTVVSGPNQSSSMQIVNGSVSGSMTYSYYLQPRSIGKFTIGSATIDYNGRPMSTEPLTITVVKGTPKQTGAAQGHAGVTTQDISDNLFILATADKRDIYLGQQVVVTYKLYTRLPIASQLQVSKLPSYEGLWAEEINLPGVITFSTEVYKGKQYRVGVLKKVALFPSQLGELSVTPMVLDIPVEIRQKRSGGDVFNQFFNDPFFNSYQTIDYKATSNTIKLDVRPLPSKNVPKSFDGAVGNYTLSSQLDTAGAQANEPLTWKIQLSGEGNIQLLDMPPLNLPSGFDQYQPKTSQQINRDGTISGSKTFDYLVVPRVAGKRVLTPVEFSYFNPAKNSYVTLSTPSYTVDIRQGVGGGTEAAGYSKEGIKVLGEDIRYIKASTDDLHRTGTSNVFGVGFWTAAFLPLIALTGLVTYKRRQDKLAGNIQLLRYRQAEKIARSRFKNAKTLMGAGNEAGFYAEISQALFGYLAKSEMSLERAIQELQVRNIDGELILNLKDSIEKCEFARFAPPSNGTSAMSGMYNELSRVIIELERSLSVKKHA
ncbi:MAG: BatD family protein [Bacteroidetes bacterium]|nr:BatD family protein [Bacteroidota bacterium]